MALNPAMILPRTALVDRILAAHAPLVVLEAPAGMGKSVLLGLIAARIGGVVYVQGYRV